MGGADHGTASFSHVTHSPPPSSSALQVRTQLSLQVRDIDDLARLAKMFAASGLFGRSNNPDAQVAECAIRMMAGMEAGFSPFASASGVHIIEGKPAFSSNLMAQAVRRHPIYDYQILQNTDTVCEIKFTANGKLLGVGRFTLEMAKRAGLATKAIWQKYPEAMLFSRALTAGMRTHCPDALGGHTAYTPEELGATGQIDQQGMVDVTVAEVPAAPQPEPVVMPMLKTIPELVAGATHAATASGLTPDGIAALAQEISSGSATTLEELPANMLARLAKNRLQPETVARCNAAAEALTTPADDEGDLPVAWTAA